MPIRQEIHRSICCDAPISEQFARCEDCGDHAEPDSITAPKTNFVLINADINVVAASNDYDRLQDKADRHNEQADFNEFYYVISRSDLQFHRKMESGRTA